LGEVENPSILKKGRSHPNTLLAAPPAATTIAKRFSPLARNGHWVRSESCLLLGE
jgi:hypothetical protein